MPEEFVLPEAFVNALEDLHSHADPESCVTVSFSTGDNFTIELEEGETTTLGELLDRNRIIVSQGTQFFVEGTEVNRSFEVAAGASIQAVGAAKGG